ncbi:MAG: hypothetical protein DHS80DRAFT_19487 [Piptocephalis tieghemiana]|nr:MAG: hypothetical protein DHS80DRAFT_19487 [Piptocephalis tieghemiana]
MPKAPYVGAIDQGTSSSRFLVLDARGTLLASHQEEFPQIYPSAGWHEHDPWDIMDSVRSCMRRVSTKLFEMGLNPEDVKYIGIANQRETTVCWSSKDGQPFHNAIVWDDARTKDLVSRLSNTVNPEVRESMRKKCGLQFSTYFSAIKMHWLFDTVPEIRDGLDKGVLKFGTIDSWLIYNLTGGAKHNGAHLTDVTNASRTMLMDLHTLNWDLDLCNTMGVPMSILPKIQSSAESFGQIHEDFPFAGATITGVLGDQQAALVGQRCFEPGDAKATYGTGSFILFNTGNEPTFSSNGLLTTVGFKMGKDAKPFYALEGSIAVAGSAIKWLRDSMEMVKDAQELSRLASEVEDTAGVYFVTALSGLFAPYWRDDARGTIVGLTQFTNKRHLARATLEATFYQIRAILESIDQDSTYKLRSVKVDGGMSNSDIGMQINADLVGIDVERPMFRETTALGAIIAAGIGGGVWKADGERTLAIEGDGAEVFRPIMHEELRQAKYDCWKRAVERSFGWIRPGEEDAMKKKMMRQTEINKAKRFSSKGRPVPSKIE